MNLTVGDLYCGAGGFSEGFRQAGFGVKWAVDDWPPAVKTFRKNHPGVRVIDEDILKLESGTLERVDVIIGGPPCTHFSLAHRGGRGDKKEGRKLVIRFLEIVDDLRPKYWIMENVPHLKASFRAEMDDGEIRLPDRTVEIPRVKVLTASHYGTPQARHRLFSGDFPLPDTSNHESKVGSPTLGKVISTLPDPSGDPKAERLVRDPLYPGVTVLEENLRDHFEDHRIHLTTEEVQRCVEEKQRHRVYGRMAFPDPLDRPSRTITAMTTYSSRSTIVIVCPHHLDNETYRTLTIRECASLQGFPIVYQFWGGTATQKDNLIGNAVPPPLARALAIAILAEEGKEPPEPPRVHTPDSLPSILRIPQRPDPKYSLTRRFRRYVRTDWSPDCRVELDNAGKDPLPHPLTSRSHLVKWTPRLYLGYAKKYRCYELGHPDALRIMDAVNEAPQIDSRLPEALAAIVAQAEEMFPGRLPDASTLQAIWAQRSHLHPTPRDILLAVERIVEENLPAKEWANAPLQRGIYSEVLQELFLEGGEYANPKPPQDMTIRTLGSLLALSVACMEINKGSEWLESNGRDAYVPDHATDE